MRSREQSKTVFTVVQAANGLRVWEVDWNLARHREFNFAEPGQAPRVVSAEAYPLGTTITITSNRVVAIQHPSQRESNGEE